MEDVSIAYEKIIWTWVPDGVEYEDSWGAIV
jgi:type VI secretion system secreted protein Hcp